MSRGWEIGLILVSLEGEEEPCASAQGEVSNAKNRGCWNLISAACPLACRLRFRTAHVTMG